MEQALDPAELDRARTLLAQPAAAAGVWPVLAAASAFAASSLLFAAAMVIAPPVKTGTSPQVVRAEGQVKVSPGTP